MFYRISFFYFPSNILCLWSPFVSFPIPVWELLFLFPCPPGTWHTCSWLVVTVTDEPAERSVGKSEFYSPKDGGCGRTHLVMRSTLQWQNSRPNLRISAEVAGVHLAFCCTELLPLTQMHTHLHSVSASFVYCLSKSCLFVFRKGAVHLEDFHCIAMLGRGHFGKVV